MRRAIRAAFAAIVLALAVSVLSPAPALADDCKINGQPAQSCTCNTVQEQPARAPGRNTVWTANCRSFGYRQMFCTSRVGPNGPWNCISEDPPPNQPRPAPQQPPLIPSPSIDPDPQRTEECRASWTVEVGSATNTDMLLTFDYGDGGPLAYYVIPAGSGTVAFHLTHTFPPATEDQVLTQRATVTDTGAFDSSETFHLDEAGGGFDPCMTCATRSQTITM